MKLRGTRFERGLLLATALLALAGALASLADVAWWLELFAHFRPQYALLLAVCSGGWLLLRRFPPAVAALALAIANAVPLLHYYPQQNQVGPADGGLRAVLANVWFRNSRPDATLEYLRELHPDLAILLETTAAWREPLQQLRDTLPYQATAGEIFVASRQPLKNFRAVPLARRGAVAVVFSQESAGVPITVIGAHTNWPLGPAIAASRDLELAQLGLLARGVPGPVLLLGDFNASAFSPVFTRLLATSGLHDCAFHRGFHPTWPTFFPPLSMQIDHCLVSTGISVRRLETGPFLGSDHFPLEVDLAWAPPALQRRAGR